MYASIMKQLLKQYHCNNSWEFKISQQMSSEIYFPPPSYQNWLLICETGNTHSTCIRTFTWRWVVGEVNYFEMLDWFPFFPRKRFLVNSLERTCCFLKQERTLEIGFSQSCVCTIFILVDNLPMQNELTFAS